MADRANGDIVLAALDEGDSAIVVLRPDVTGMFRIVDVNGTFSRITNYTSVEAAGTLLSDLKGPSTDIAMQDKIDDAMRGGQSLRGEIEYTSRVGRLFWFGFTLMPVVDPVTRGLHCVLLGRDITEKRKQDSEQAGMQTMLALVFQKIDAPVVITRPNGYFLLANTAWQNLLGYRAHEVLRLAAHEVTAPAYQDIVTTAHARQFIDSKPYELEVAVVHKNGTHIPVFLKSAILQRSDMQKFRIVTLRPIEQPAAQASPKPMRQAVVGCVQFLGLDAIKEAYGARWASVGERLLLAAESILKRRLSKEDVLSRTADQGFCIWFKEGTQEENSARVTRIGREIRVMLLGELGEDAEFSICSYAQVSNIEDSAASSSSIMTSLARSMADHRSEMEQQARAFLDRVVKQQQSEPAHLSNRAGRVIRAAFVELPRDLRGRFAGAISLVSGVRADVESGLIRLGLAANVVLGDLAEGRDDMVRLVTIPFGLFKNHRGREEFLEQWRSYPSSMGPRLLVMLSELPPEIRRKDVLQTLELVRSVSKRIGVLLDNIENPPLNLTISPFNMVGLVSDNLKETSDGTLRDFIQRMQAVKSRVVIRLAADESPHRWLSLGADLTAVP